MKNQPFNPFYAEQEEIRNEAYLRLAKMVVIAFAIGCVTAFLVVPKEYWWGAQ